MIGFIYAAVVVLYSGALLWLLTKTLENGLWFLAAGGLLILSLGFLFNLGIAAERSGPCVQYETQMHYNPATKTTMPARVCVLRGEWIQEN